MCFSLISSLKFLFIGLIGICLLWFCLISLLYRNEQCYFIEVKKSSRWNWTNSTLISSIDRRLKLHHFSILGTHNSYHRSNLFYRVDQSPLNEQFSNGIRQIELDIHLMSNHLVVYHLQLLDDRSHCYCLIQCFIRIEKWLNDHRSSYPIYLFFEIKQMFYEDLYTGLVFGVQCEHFQQIRTELLRIFPINSFLSPVDVQSNFSSLRAALKQQSEDESNGDYSEKNFGWPSIGKSLGKLIPVFLDDVHEKAQTLYSKCSPLRQFFFIAQSKFSLPYSSIISLTHSNFDEDFLRERIKDGQILRLLLKSDEKQSELIYRKFPRYSIHLFSQSVYPSRSSLIGSMFYEDFHPSPIQCHSLSSPSFCSTKNFSSF